MLAERENQSDMLGGVGNVSLDDKDRCSSAAGFVHGWQSKSEYTGRRGRARNMGQVTKLHKKRVEQAAFLCSSRRICHPFG